ncbi:MAG: SRPBCC family protein [Terracoccus sp.]
MSGKAPKARFDVVTREVRASPEAVFAVLADPARHPALDDSGMVVRLVAGVPVTAVGQVFRMAMSMGPGNHYETDNHVTVCEPGRAIGWAVADPGQQPLGWSWRFDLEPSEGGTLVRQTYDWSGVTDPEVLRTIPFPAVPRDVREETLVLLAEAVEH